MAKHTPTPWVADLVGIPGTNKNAIEHADNEGRLYFIAGNLTEDDAKRIVSCVNMLEGIPTAALETFRDKSLIFRLGAFNAMTNYYMMFGNLPGEDETLDALCP